MKHTRWIPALLVLALMLAMVSGCLAEQVDDTQVSEVPGTDVVVDEALPEDEAQTDEGDAPADEEAQEDNPSVQIPFALTLEPAELSLDYSQRATLTASASIGAGSIQWANSDENVVSISRTTGDSVIVTALNEGTATVTCSLGGATQSCEVTVKSPQTLQITGVDYPATLARGKSWTLQGGTVASPDNIIDVSSVIKGANGVELVPSYYAMPMDAGVKRFEISGIDAHVPFSRIPENGGYIWKLTARDEGGRTVTLELPINVVSSGETVVATETGAYSDGTVTAPAPDAEQGAPEAVTPTAPEGIMITAVPGRNRVLNSAFEHGQDYWDDWGEPATREFVEQDGKYWCHIVGTPNARWQGVRQNPYTAGHITVTGYDSYTFSARVKAAAENTNFALGVHWLDADNNIITQSWNRWRDIGTEEQTVSFTMTAPPATEHFNLMVGVDDVDSPAVHDVYFTDVKLEFGDAATAWIAAPEDEPLFTPGRNLILNSAFERGHDGWADWGEPATREFVGQDGETWCHIVGTPNAHWQGVQQEPVWQDIAIEGGTTYTFSAKVKAAAEDTIFTLAIHWLDGEMHILSQTWQGWTIGTQEQDIEFTVPADPGSSRIRIMLGVSDPESPAVHDVYFTDIKFEAGDRATDWTAAPEDAQ